MKMFQKLFCTAVLVFLSSAPLHGAEDSSRQQAALELLEIMQVEKSVEAGSAAMVNAMVQNNPSLEPYRELVTRWAENIITWDSIGPKMINLYAATYTVQELRDLTAFYRTPTGQKLLQTLPELIKKQALIGSELAQANVEELRNMIAEHQKVLDEK